MKKKIFSITMCFLIIVTFMYNLIFPLTVKASSPGGIVLGKTDVQFALLESFGYIIGLATGIDSNLNEGKAYSSHDLALLSYDYLTSKGFNDTALDTFFSVWYLNSNWELGNLSDITRADIENYERTGEYSNYYVQYKENSKTIFDTFKDFIASIKDGTNTVQLGGKDIVLENPGALTGFTGDIEADSDGNYHRTITDSQCELTYYFIEYSTITRPDVSTFKLAFYITEQLEGTFRLACLVKSKTSGISSIRYFSQGGPMEIKVSRYYRDSGERSEKDDYVYTNTSIDLSKLHTSFNTNAPVFATYDAAKSYLENGILNDVINAEKAGLDHSTIAQDVVNKVLLPLIGSAISVNGLRDIYTDTKDKYNNGAIADTNVYIDTVVDSLKDVPTLDKPSIDEPIPLPGADADILEWLKAIASTVVLIPSELRKISLTALESSVGSIANSFPAVKKELETITDIFPAIRQDVKTIGDVFPALRQDVQSIADEFPALRKTLDAVGDIFPAINNSLDSIVDVFPSFIDFQSAVLPKINDIADVLPTAFENIDARIGSLADSFDLSLSDTLDIPLTDIIDRTGTISDTIAKIKDFILSLPDYTDFLKAIIGLLKDILSKVGSIADFFVLDMDVITDALSDSLTDMRYNTGLEPLLNFYEKIKFTDNYEYPQLKMAMPFYTKEYFSESEIVLIDTSDYAKQFLYIRTLLKFCLWFTFGLVQFKNIKVYFHIG